MQSNKNILCLIYLVLTLTCYSTEAQETSSSFLNSHLIVNNWNNKSGIPQNTIFDIVKDSQGRLWFSTEEGIVSFNGYNFKVYNEELYPIFQENLFHMLDASVNGGIWACNDTDLVHINETAKVYKFTSSIDEVITSIGEDRSGKLWIGTNSGNIFYYNNAKQRIEKSELNLKAQVNLIEPLSDGILIGTTEGLYKYSINENKLNYLKDIGAVNITAVAIENEQEIWAGTQNAGLFYFNKDSVIHFTEKDGLKEDFILTLTLSPNGDLFIGTSSSGIQVFSQEKFLDFDVEDFNYNDIKSLSFEDNFLWVGTSGSGLFLIQQAAVQRIPDEIQLSGNVILPIYEDTHKNIWIGTAGNGVNKITDSEVKYFKKDNGLSNEIILSIYGTDSAVYIGTANGLNKIGYGSSKVDKVYTTEDGLVSNIIKTVYFSTDKKLWVTTRSGGIHNLNSSGKFTQLKLPEHLTDADFNSIFEKSNGSIWIGTKDSGIIVIGSEDKVTHIPLAGKLETADILSFYEDDENIIWAGTDKGLVRIDEGEHFLVNKENGLKFNEAHNIIKDHNNILWISGNHGIQAFPADDLRTLSDGSKDTKLTVKLFDSSKGMKNDETNGGIFPAGTKLTNGNIWFPTVDGIAVINPDVNVYINNEKPEIHIEHLKFANQVYTDINDLTIPPGTINIEIAYASINFTEPSSVNYLYRIKELGMDWENVGNRTTGYFTIQDPGKYTFEVRSELFGKLSETKSFSFIVSPFFYQMAWFKLTVFIAGLALLLLAIDVYYKRKKQIELGTLIKLRTSELQHSNDKLKVAIKDVEEQNIQLKNIAWTQSHVVRSPLARILGFIDLIARKNPENEDMKIIIEHLKKSGNELDEVIRDTVRKSEGLIKNL